MLTTPLLHVQISQVTMTPEWASQILDHNTRNRAARPLRVKRIADDIASGRWMLTPQTVSIASNGTLLDGQHRLMAVVQAGRSVEMMLATGCPSECFAAIDTGDSRTPGDILKIEGASNYNTVAAIIKTVHLYNKYPGNSWTGPLANLSKQEIAEYYRADPDGWERAAKFAISLQKSPCVQVTAIGAFNYLYSSAGFASSPSGDDEKFSQEYLQLYCTGEMLSAGNPILAFRNWQAVYWKVAQVKKVQTQLACHIKAYRYWRDEVQLKQFKQSQIPPMPRL
jgi:hypothetical protein